MTDDAEYTFLAHRFNRQVGVSFEGFPFNDDVLAQFEVFEEEVEELQDAMDESDYDGCKEEIADVLVTLFILADRMDIDIDTAYERKMAYNLQKQGVRDENGKVIDDVDREKPDFSAIDEGFKP